jgi:hypothetical protein
VFRPSDDNSSDPSLQSARGWSALSLLNFSSHSLFIFVERSSTIECTCYPPPQKKMVNC